MKRFGRDACEVKWSPGNGTMYHLVLTRLDERLMLTWLNNGGGGVSVITNDPEGIYYPYLMEKMKVTISDATALASFFRWYSYAGQFYLPKAESDFFAKVRRGELPEGKPVVIEIPARVIPLD